MLIGITLLSGCMSKGAPATNIKGKIVMSSPTNTVMDKDTVVIYDLEKKNYIKFGGTFYDSPAFSKDKSRVLMIIEESPCTIVQYDYVNNTYEFIYKGSLQDGTVLEYAYYVPDKNAVSFIQDDKLYIYDMLTKQKTYVIDANWGYFWNSQGDKIVYSQNGKIYTYELLTAKKKYLMEGKNPQFSNNNQLIGCITYDDNGKQILVIRNIDDGKEWEYKPGGMIINYRFSPDDNNIAIEESRRANFFFEAWDLNLWNFRKNTKSSILKNVANVSSSIDWK